MAPPQVDVHGTLGAAERAAVLALIEAAAAADGFRPLSDQKWLRVAAGRHPLSLLAWVPSAGRADGPLIGYGQLGPGDDGRTYEAVVHPDHRDAGGTVDELLARSALAETARQGDTRVRWWMPRASDERQALASRLGFTLERELLQLRAPLPLAGAARVGAPSVPVRPFVVGRDEGAWLTVNNRAFAAHPEQGVWQLDDLVLREQEPWFDADGFLLHEEGGRLAAFCWTKVHEETRPVLGEIYVIGVDPDYQGRHLGRALAVAGLDHLARRGVTNGMLYVDAGNDAALGLYRSLGFGTHQVDRAYVRPVRPARTDQKPEAPTSRPMP